MSQPSSDRVLNILGISIASLPLLIMALGAFLLILCCVGCVAWGLLYEPPTSPA